LACCLDKGVSSGKSPDVVCRGKQAKELVESFFLNKSRSLSCGCQ
jgi:hypothetical protein